MKDCKNKKKLYDWAGSVNPQPLASILQNMRQYIIFLAIFITFLGHAQSNLNKSSLELFLSNSLDTSKKVKLQKDKLMTIHIKEFQDVSMTKIIRYNCSIDSFKDSILTCNIKGEFVNIDYENGCYSRTESNYFNNDDSLKNQIMTININKIWQIENSSVCRDNIHITGNTIIGVSVLTTLILAPLISINYKNGTFNSDKYFTLAGAGLVGIAIGIPISALTVNKKYYLTEKNKIKKRNYWYFNQ
ncbi:MAG: hypothetical protein V2A54_14040 [Bacteroidota bacterium]